jgi:hypothetical protein
VENLMREFGYGKEKEWLKLTKKTKYSFTL